MKTPEERQTANLCFFFILLTCIRVLMTSSGVFPNTLAAPAMTPKAPVTRGLKALLGLSPGVRTEQKIHVVCLCFNFYCRVDGWENTTSVPVPDYTYTIRCILALILH